MSENGMSFRQKLLITVIDKFAIALIILVVGFFLNKFLKNHEHFNSVLLEEYKNRIELKSVELKNRFVESHDSLQRDYNLKQEMLNRKYIENKNEFERKYKSEREDLIRRENQFYNEKLLTLENQQKIQLEILKQNNNLSNSWVETSVDKIGKAWELINTVNLSSEMVQDSIYMFFVRDSILLRDSIINIKNKSRPCVIVKSMNDRRMIYDKKEYDNASRACDLLYFTLWPDRKIKRGYSRDRAGAVLDWLYDDERILFIWEDTPYKIDKDRLGLKTLNDQVNNAITFINQNRFWIGEEQRNGMMDFLNSQKSFINELPNSITLNEMNSLNINLNRKRLDIYQLGNKLFDKDK